LEIFCKLTGIAIARMLLPESNTQRNIFNHHFIGGTSTILVPIDNDTRGIGELDFFDNP
jgi:hypothetical protein